MSDLISVTGVVLSAMPVGEYDKRIVLLTKERGKITAFVRGARRPGSQLMAAANPFVFGSFSLYEGRSSYNLTQVSVKRHFTELAAVQPEVYYGYYFLELADYYGREYTDEIQMINLLYVTIKALLNPRLDNHLIRRIYELKTMVIQGEYPQMFACNNCGNTQELLYYSETAQGMLCKDCFGQSLDAVLLDASVLYTMQYIIASPVEKLYTFAVAPQIQKQLDHLLPRWLAQRIDRKLKSQGILEMMD